MSRPPNWSRSVDTSESSVVKYSLSGVDEDESEERCGVRVEGRRGDVGNVSLFFFFRFVF